MFVCFFSYYKGVWAGWGHASENPKLPELLNKAGISFLGKKQVLKPREVFRFGHYYLHHVMAIAVFQGHPVRPCGL